MPCSKHVSVFSPFIYVSACASVIVKLTPVWEACSKDTHAPLWCYLCIHPSHLVHGHDPFVDIFPQLCSVLHLLALYTSSLSHNFHCIQSTIFSFTTWGSWVTQISPFTLKTKCHFCSPLLTNVCLLLMNTIFRLVVMTKKNGLWRLTNISLKYLCSVSIRVQFSSSVTPFFSVFFSRWRVILTLIDILKKCFLLQRVVSI